VSGGRLVVCPTPIGNLGDRSPRAANTLRSADLILAEDTRVTAKLLAHIGAKVPMIRYDDHSSEADRQAIVARQIRNFHKFPPRQKPASVNLDAVMRTLEEAHSSAGH